jgi:hypothetical protein
MSRGRRAEKDGGRSPRPGEGRTRKREYPRPGSRSPPDPRAVSPSRNPAKGAAAAGFSGGEPAGREQGGKGL